MYGIEFSVIPRAAPTAMREGRWNVLTSPPLCSIMERKDSTITTKLTDPILKRQYKVSRDCSILLKAYKKPYRKSTVVRDIWMCQSKFDSPYTILPIVSSLDPPTGHLLMSSELAFLWSQTSSTLDPMSNTESIPVASNEREPEVMAA